MGAIEGDVMDLAAELMNARPLRDGRSLKIIEVFGDQPEVLDAIRTARVERGLSYRVIAQVLSKSGEKISEGAVQNYLRAEGIA
jgi:hypothetical protein